MNNHDDGKRRVRSDDAKMYTAASVSGASQNRRQSLLPMLIGGLVLIVVGMIAVVLFA